MSSSMSSLEPDAVNNSCNLSSPSTKCKQGIGQCRSKEITLKLRIQKLVSYFLLSPQQNVGCAPLGTPPHDGLHTPTSDDPTPDCRPHHRAQDPGDLLPPAVHVVWCPCPAPRLPLPAGRQPSQVDHGAGKGGGGAPTSQRGGQKASA